jgi:putative SOS response-associated peptidase YedK
MLKEYFPILDLAEVQPHYNIAPTQMVLAVRHLPQAGRPECVPLRWGLIPYWAEDMKVGPRMINARAETAATKSAFAPAFRQRRCLILADGFYEWQKNAGRKQPFYIRRADGKPFAFAGLWERWNKAEQPVESCTILTTDANDLVRPLHDRMPVILDPAAYDRWLDPTCHDPTAIQGLLRPFAAASLTAYPVSTQVNNARFDDPVCVLPLAC